MSSFIYYFDKYSKNHKFSEFFFKIVGHIKKGSPLATWLFKCYDAHIDNTCNDSIYYMGEEAFNFQTENSISFTIAMLFINNSIKDIIEFSNSLEKDKHIDFFSCKKIKLKSDIEKINSYGIPVFLNEFDVCCLEWTDSNQIVPTFYGDFFHWLKLSKIYSTVSRNNINIIYEKHNNFINASYKINTDNYAENTEIAIDLPVGQFFPMIMGADLQSYRFIENILEFKNENFKFSFLIVDKSIRLTVSTFPVPVYKELEFIKPE